MLVWSRSRRTTRRRRGTEVGGGGDKALEIKKVGSPQSLAMVEPLRRKDSLVGGESEGVQGPERPTQEESLPERSPRTQNATRILSSPILSPASTATLFTAQPPIPYSPTEPPILESPASSNVVYSASHPPPPSPSTRTSFFYSPFSCFCFDVLVFGFGICCSFSLFPSVGLRKPSVPPSSFISFLLFTTLPSLPRRLPTPHPIPTSSARSLTSPLPIPSPHTQQPAKPERRSRPAPVRALQIRQRLRTRYSGSDATGTYSRWRSSSLRL